MLCRACYSPPFGLRSTGRLTRYVFKYILVLAVHVNAKLAFVSPRDHFHPSTSVIAPLSSPRCCYRQRPRHALCTKSTLYTIEIAVPFKMSVRLIHFPLCSFFSYPPPIHLRRLLSLRSTPTAHLRNMWGGGVVYGSISRLLPIWQYHSYLCAVQEWRCSVYVA